MSELTVRQVKEYWEEPAGENFLKTRSDVLLVLADAMNHIDSLLSHIEQVEKEREVEESKKYLEGYEAATKETAQKCAEIAEQLHNDPKFVFGCQDVYFKIKKHFNL